LGLITIIVVAQAPALPQPLPQLLSDSRDGLNFWFHASGWGRRLQDIIGQSATPPPQETQADRDARVASIKIFPGDVNIQMGRPEFFDALAYDGQGRQVGGVKFIWRAEELLTAKAVNILQTGEFIPPAVGSYKLTVEGAGKTAQATVIAVLNLVQQQPHIELEIEPGPGWGGDNYKAARDPVNEVANPPGRPLHHGAGSANFQFTAPILSLAGRGLDISLGAVYNSREWTVWTRPGAQSYTDITYDIDRDWPAPGWSLGFGRVAGLGLNGAMIIDADGTRHSFSGTVTQPQYPAIHFEGHTTDGTFIDYSSNTDSTGTINFAQANYPNGTVIKYLNPSRGAVYPRRITDANGNYISVQYKDVSGAQRGPKILFITDTLGRTINFYYDAGRLTAITQPGVNGAERQVVRFHYKTLTLNYAFSSTLTTHVDNATPDVLDAIYYPGTGTGYWFGDADSYSGYGMLAKYSEQRGMGFTATSLDTQGTVTAGTITRQYTYDYAMTPDNTLTDAPAYTTMTETWAGMDTAAAVTSYHSDKTGSVRNTTITFPDGSKSVQLSYNLPGQYNDGYIYEDDTYDSNSSLLRRSTVTWAQGDYSSARPVRIEAIDELNQKTAAEFDYAASPSYNQVVTVRDYDYGGMSLLRTTTIDYRNSTDYINRNIFNLVRRVDVFDPGGTRVSRTDYGHDEPADTTLAGTPGVVQHEAKYDPNDSNYDPSTHYRGNVTSITRYASASDLTGPITETRTYDITGNMVTTSSSCCEQISFTYRLDVQFAYPQFRTRGSADTTSPDRVTTEVRYNFNTGLGVTAIDANGRSTQTSYFADTLRPQTLTLPTAAYTNYSYDDTAMSITETAYKDASTIASQNVKSLNGLGQIKTENALGQNSTLDYVDTTYDAMGRVWKQTRPYRTGQTQQWSETLYDALGRSYQVTAPDGSQSKAFYNEATRPPVASATAGQTTRVVDAWGRERWARMDADSRLVEVVEPNPSGNGSVSAAGGLVTTYSYDTLGNLTQVNQGAQQRKFKYDSLKRLTNQKLAEESATLNDQGTYVGTSTGTWSEVFTYDERSNLITQTDARGVKTIYSYNSDPLNRLQSVSYDTSGFGDATHPILSAPPSLTST
jgi:YD repeat-containing protein